MIGTLLGKYRIEAELSRGGQGAVYRGRHEVLERAVAIKMLRPEMTTGSELLLRFVNEAKAASAIRHPSIIEIFDFGHTDDGQAYLVMELLDGETLSSRLAKRGKLAEPDAIRITQGIAAALGAAHAKGIFHRDLKPDNVFLIPDPDLGERAKVLDFGIAKLSDQASQLHTRTGALMGTPLYMAPEQARSAGLIDHRADLYSLGCILYELLTGKPPLVGEGSGEIIALHLFTEPAPPSTLVSVTPGLERIVMRLLEKEPSARYASASDLVDALASLGSPTRVQPVTPPPPDTSMRLAVAAPPLPARGIGLPVIAGGVMLALAGVVAIAVLAGGTGDKAAPAPKLPPTPVSPTWKSPVIETGVRDVTPVAPVHIEPVKPAPPPTVPTRPGRPARPGRGSGTVRNTDNASPIEIEP